MPTDPWLRKLGTLGELGIFLNVRQRGKRSWGSPCPEARPLPPKTNVILLLENRVLASEHRSRALSSQDQGNRLLDFASVTSIVLLSTFSTRESSRQSPGPSGGWGWGVKWWRARMSLPRKSMNPLFGGGNQSRGRVSTEFKVMSAIDYSPA